MTLPPEIVSRCSQLAELGNAATVNTVTKRSVAPNLGILTPTNAAAAQRAGSAGARNQRQDNRLTPAARAPLQPLVGLRLFMK